MLLLFCSRFDDTTSLGKDIIQDIDPSLTDVNGNFKSLDSMTVLSAFSIPDLKGSNNGIHRSTISVGTMDNVTASGFVEYTANADILDKFGIAVTDTSTFKIDSISMQVYTYKLTDENIRIPEKLNLYLSINTDSVFRTPLSRQLQVSSLYLSKDSTSKDSTHYYGSSNDTIIRKSIEKFISSIKTQLKICATDSCKNLLKNYLRFYLYSADSGSSVAHLSTAPTIRIYSRNGLDNIMVSITPSYTNYVAIDNETDSTSKIPVSTIATKRTAVFKMDMSNLWKTMESFKSFRILSAGFTVTPKTYKNIFDSLNVHYHLSDTLYDNTSAFQKQILRGVKKMVSIDSTGIPKERFVLRNLEDIFQKLSFSRPSTLYLYLQISSEKEYRWKEVLWNNPEFNATLTTLE